MYNDDLVSIAKRCVDCQCTFMGLFWAAAVLRLPAGTVVRGQCPSCLQAAETRIADRETLRRASGKRRPAADREPDLRLPLEEP